MRDVTDTLALPEVRIDSYRVHDTLAEEVREGLSRELKELPPKYLYDARGFDIKEVGAFAWIPYAAAGIGCLVGGWLSSWLLTREVPLDRARKIALGLSAAVMPARPPPTTTGIGSASGRSSA